MDSFFSLISMSDWAVCLAIATIAGLIKGMVGFAMPMIMVSLMSMVISPEFALAGLILPTLATNGTQAFRQGAQLAKQAIRRFRVFLCCGCIALLVSAQLINTLPLSVLLGVIGLPIVAFAVLQLLGKHFHIARQRSDVEAGFGTLAGALGGLSGIWGPPTVVYLTALGTEKSEQMRIQGVIYGLGAIALFVGHISSGLLNAGTNLFSASLILPALFGQWLGGILFDRIDQAVFKTMTLWVLLIVGLNLIRRAFFA